MPTGNGTYVFFHLLNLTSNFDLTFLRNPCLQVKLFFTARCADDTDSTGIGTTGLASVVCPLLISATFRAVLHHCARPHDLAGGPHTRHGARGGTSYTLQPGSATRSAFTLAHSNPFPSSQSLGSLMV